jgi:hypothetical protein
VEKMSYGWFHRRVPKVDPSAIHIDIPDVEIL